MTGESGTAALCDSRGYVLKVLHDGLGMSSRGMASKNLQACLTPESVKPFRRFTKQVMQEGACFGLVVQCVDREQCLSLSLNGVMVQGQILLTATNARPESGFDRLYNEITALNNDLVNTKRELAKKNVELDRLASVDALTSISNRRIILEHIDEQFRLARRYGIVFSLVMADLDHFKVVNDNYGHLIGDAVLKKIGSIIEEAIRDTDHAGRYGGEEFMIILANTGAGEACQVAERIRQGVAEIRFETETGNNFGVTISLGVATYSDDATLESIIDRADKALYMAKETGRNRVKA